MFLKSHGGAKIEFVEEEFNVVGDLGEGKKLWGSFENRGGAQKNHRKPFHGGCYRGV